MTFDMFSSQLIIVLDPELENLARVSVQKVPTSNIQHNM